MSTVAADVTMSSAPVVQRREALWRIVLRTGEGKIGIGLGTS